MLVIDRNYIGMVYFIDAPPPPPPQPPLQYLQAALSLPPQYYYYPSFPLEFHSYQASGYYLNQGLNTMINISDSIINIPAAHHHPNYQHRNQYYFFYHYNELLLNPDMQNVREDDTLVLNLHDSLAGDEDDHYGSHRSTNSGLTVDIITKMLKTSDRSTKSKNDDDNETCEEICVICQEDISDLEIHQKKIVKLECKHEYHVECITKWLLQKNFCPVCKSKALPVD